MIKANAQLEDILKLHSILEKVYFKDFWVDFDFPKGLNHTHLKTLIILYFEGSCSMSTVSEMTNLEKGSFTPVANKLIKLDYINKQQNIADKRIYDLTLTRNGQRLADRFIKTHINYIDHLLSALTYREKEDYFAALNYIRSTTSKLVSPSKQEEPVVKSNVLLDFLL